MASLTIDCDGCIMRDTDACGDCVVTFLCNRGPHDAVIFDVAEERALRLLGRNGLVPPLRHRGNGDQTGGRGQSRTIDGAGVGG